MSGVKEQQHEGSGEKLTRGRCVCVCVERKRERKREREAKQLRGGSKRDLGTVKVESGNCV